MPRAKASLLMILTTVMTVAVLFLLPYTPAQIVHTVVAEKGEWMRSTLLSGVVSYADEELCIAPLSGKISRVYAEPGQMVKEGDLLLAMDTSAFEAALQTVQQMRYEYQKAVAQMESSIKPFTMHNELAWQEEELQLKQAIERAKVRSQREGMVEAVYVMEGGYVEAGSLLGRIHDGGRCITASAGMNVVRQMERGTLAALESNGKTLGAAKISQIYAPTESGQGMQTLTLLPLDQEQLALCEPGRNVTVEVLLEKISDRVLIPLSAVDAQGRVWYVENGCAHAQTIDVSKRNGETVAASQEWEGRRIILAPDHLYEGCPVKEAKR